jgi:hypothetical protein
MSRATWEDPDAWAYADLGGTRVPEHKTNRIYPYTNRREDRGSTSYVVPSGFVGNHVKSLGLQFQGFVGTNDQFDNMTNAMGSMVGCPRSK